MSKQTRKSYPVVKLAAIDDYAKCVGNKAAARMYQIAQ